MTTDVGERIVAFRRELEARCAQRVEETTYGHAYLHLGFPLRWSSNLVWADARLDGVDADALGADADRVLGAHDEIRHRRVDVHDAANGQRLASGFLDLGWSVERDVTMVQTREPEPRPPIDVREVDFATARPLIAQIMRQQPYADSGQVIAQLVGFREVLEREVGARFFVAEAEGTLAAICEAYLLGDLVQVEDVNTLEGFQGRGLASAVVLAAVAWGRERGADLAFLVADDEDWPKELYRRLGFDEVARTWAFTRQPSR